MPHSFLQEKTISITGASKGLGKALADLLRSKGATVITSDVTTGADFHADVTLESDVAKFAESIITKHGSIDIWINNAGIWLSPEPIDALRTEKVQRLFQVNFFGTLHGMKVAAQQMKKQGHGTIVNIISTTAFDGMNGSSGSVYAASKYAIRGLTNAVREELKDTKISVIGVYPGGMKTDLFNEAKPENFEDFMSVESVAEKIVENLEREIPEKELILKRPGQISVELQ